LGFSKASDLTKSESFFAFDDYRMLKMYKRLIDAVICSICRKSFQISTFIDHINEGPCVAACSSVEFQSIIKEESTLDD
jgi:hypothetical protein